MPLSEAAQILGVSSRTLLRYCQAGRIACIAQPYGHKTSYLLNPDTVELLRLQGAFSRSKPATNKPLPERNGNLKALLPDWYQAMAKGLIGGKPFSPRTIADYRYYAEAYFERRSSLSIEEFRAALAKIPPERFATRAHFYKAIRCFVLFLNSQAGGGCSATFSDFIKEAAALKPKRHLPPKRQTVTEAGLAALLKACEKPSGGSPYERALVTLLSQTGIRAAECCALTLGDLDWEQGVLTIRHGKGGKRRRLGLSDEVMGAMREYLGLAGFSEFRFDVGRAPSPLSPHWGNTRHRVWNSSTPLFQDRKGKPLSRSGLYQRLERIGRRAGVKVSPHALRRAFVTINANRGRPLQMLQMACAHSSILTTRDYCQTLEQEMITAMKQWGQSAPAQ